MPDLTIIYIQQCETLERGSTIGEYIISPLHDGWRCTCHAYKYSKPENKGCKHIEQHIKERCTWHSQFGIAQTEEQEENNICPECGRDTVIRGFGV